MNSILSKMFTAGLTVFLLFALSVVSYVMRTDITQTRTLMNETNNFIEKVTDTGVCSDKMLSDYYLAAASNADVNVTVKRYEAIINPLTKDADGGTQVTYTPNSDLSVFNQGDIITVDVHYIGHTGIQQVLLKVFKIFNVKVDYTLSGLVRH